MDSVPVLGKEVEREITQYAWLVEKEDLETLQNENKLKSEVCWYFWAVVISFSCL